MAIAYDATGVGYAGLISAGVAKTFSHTAASGADVFFALSTFRRDTISAVTYGGNAMTLVGSYDHNNSTASSAGQTFLYRRSGGGTGSSANVSFTCAQAQWAVANSISYTGVGSVGTPAYASGSGTAISTGSVSCTTGQFILAVLGVGSISNIVNPTINSPSGGNARYNSGTGAGNYDAVLCIRDATATATFAGTGSSSFLWSTVSVVLSEAAASVPTNRFFAMF
jgi:hypothetical protein